MSSSESLSYRSPVSKLVRFFRDSRDKWKAKCQAAKKENKSLKIRLAKMKESRDRWKAEAQVLREEVPADDTSAGERSKKALPCVRPGVQNDRS